MSRSLQIFTMLFKVTPCSSHRDTEAGAPVVDECDVPAEVPAGAAVDRPLRLAEVAELRRAAEVRRLQGAHRQDGRVREQIPAAKRVNK